jgi:hypothetical protein
MYGRRQFGNGFCNGLKEEGRRSFDYAQEPKQEEWIIARISAIKNAFD